VIWSIMWFFLVYDTPSQHPRISVEEKMYIENVMNKKAGEKKVVNLAHCHCLYYLPMRQRPPVLFCDTFDSDEKDYVADVCLSVCL